MKCIICPKASIIFNGGTLNFNNGTLNTQDAEIGNYSIGKAQGSGSYNLDIDVASKKADTLTLGSGSNAVIAPNITLLNVYENIEFGIEDGCFAVKKDGLWGFIDDKGNEIIPPMYQQYNSFHDGFACVKKDGLWGIIDKQNNVILPFKYYRCKDFHDGISIVENLDYSNDVIKSNGQILHSVLPFSQIFNLGNGSILLETSIKGSFQIVKIKE